MSKRKIRKELLDYMVQHKHCEACGVPVGESAMPHHIKTRGAGGSDEWANLLRLCYNCHYGLWPALGPSKFIEQFPHLFNKVTAVKYKLQERNNENLGR